MQLNKHRNAALALVTFAGLTGFAPVAKAQMGQLHPTLYGSTELDTRHSQFYLLGLYVGMGGLGWSPYFNVNGYLLHYRPIQSVDATSSLTALSPTIGRIRWS